MQPEIGPSGVEMSVQVTALSACAGAAATRPPAMVAMTAAALRAMPRRDVRILVLLSWKE
jgi:hypothetical protein